MMRKLGLVVAVAMLLSVLAASIAAATALPGATGANASGSPATDAVAAGRQRLTITDDSIWGQFGFCDDNGDVSPVSY